LKISHVRHELERVARLAPDNVTTEEYVPTILFLHTQDNNDAPADNKEYKPATQLRQIEALKMDEYVPGAHLELR
jgi:hypothetical protein